MSNLRLIVNNAADDATLSVAPAVVSTLPVTNLQLTPRAKVMRTTSTASQQIKGTWSAQRGLSGCALWRHNLTSAATWRLELFSDAAWTTSVYDSGAVLACPPKPLGELQFGVDPAGASVFSGWSYAYSSMWFPGVMAQSFRITLSDAGNPAGYLEAARLILGPYISPIYNMSYGCRLRWQDDSTATRTDGGSVRVDAAEPYRVLRFSLGLLDDVDSLWLQDMMRRTGKRRDLFVSCYPGAGGCRERNYSFACRVAGNGEQTHSAHRVWAQEVELEET